MAAMTEDEDTGWRLSAEAMARAMGSEDFKEGLMAFIEKRPPQWTGRLNDMTADNSAARTHRPARARCGRLAWRRLGAGPWTSTTRSGPCPPPARAGRWPPSTPTSSAPNRCCWAGPAPKSTPASPRTCATTSAGSTRCGLSALAALPRQEVLAQFAEVTVRPASGARGDGRG